MGIFHALGPAGRGCKCIQVTLIEYSQHQSQVNASHVILQIQNWCFQIRQIWLCSSYLKRFNFNNGIVISNLELENYALALETTSGKF